MVMLDAEQQNSILHADVNSVENYKALKAIRDFEGEDISATMALAKQKTGQYKLPSLTVRFWKLFKGQYSQ